VTSKLGLPQWMAVGGLLIGLASSGFCAQLSFKGVNAGYVMGGVYTSPYSIAVNGTAELMICDDFTAHVSGSWTANETSLSSLQSQTAVNQNLKFPQDCGSLSEQACAQQQTFNYATVAVLASQLMSLGNFYQAEAAYYSYAIWAVFYPTLVTNNPTSGVGDLTPTQLDAVNAKLSAARGIVQGNANGNGGIVNLGLLPNLTIYSPVPDGASQEFLKVSMPEPSSISIILINLLAVVGLIFVLRRRMPA
jgi:hypothetical protein